MINILGWDSREVLKRCAAVPILGEMKLAGGLAKTSHHKNHGQLGPAHLLPPLGQSFEAEFVERERLPQKLPEPDIAEGATVLHADFPRTDLDRLPRERIVKKVRLISAFAEESTGQRRRSLAILGVQQECIAMRMNMEWTVGTVAITGPSEIDGLKCPPTGVRKNCVNPCDGGLPREKLQDVVRDSPAW